MTTTLSPTETQRLGQLDATHQAQLVREGEVSAEELVTAAIERIERLNPTLNAVITKIYDRALAQVRDGLPDGPFTGVPYLLKDLCVELAGVPLNEGSRYLRDVVSPTDQELARRLHQAGLSIVGKTNTPEFGLMPTAEPQLHGPTRNPWDLTRVAGGSSGGSAAAVASGMVPFAHANDVGGSIRFPASCCGLFGFKPTRGRNPLGPRYGDVFGGLAVEHAVTRSVRDSAALLDATSGPDAGDPYVAPVPDRPFATEVVRDPGRMRIGYSLRTPGGQPVHADCVAALTDAVELLEALGHEVFSYDLPGLTHTVGEAIGTVYRCAAGWVIRHWARRVGRLPEPGELEPLTEAYWQSSASITGGEYLLAVEDLQSFSRTVAAMPLDAWLTPTLATPPVPLGTIYSTPDDPFRAERVFGDFVPFPAVVANITGAPAMSVPLFWSAGGLPIGVHLMGRYGDDAALFRLAGQLERARPWAHRYGPLATRLLSTDVQLSTEE
jgi:amidase